MEVVTVEVVEVEVVVVLVVVVEVVVVDDVVVVEVLVVVAAQTPSTQPLGDAQIPAYSWDYHSFILLQINKCLKLVIIKLFINKKGK